MPVKSLIIGAGNESQNILNHMQHIGVNGLEFIEHNTSIDELRTKLASADLIFIVVYMGESTAISDSRIIAEIAKELDILSIAIASKPFKFEGNERQKIAEKGLEHLSKEYDVIVVVKNDKLLSIIDKSFNMHETFEVVGSVLEEAIHGITGVLLPSERNAITLDLTDLKSVMRHPGLALMGVGESQGDNAAYEAIKAVIESPLLDNMSISGAKGILVHFQVHPDFPTSDIVDVMEIIYESTENNADVIFGTTIDIDMPIDAVSVTLIATGFGGFETLVWVNNLDYASDW